MRALAMVDASVLGLLLGSISLVHAYWALGGVWPGIDRADLKAKVLGGPPGQAFPSPFAGWLVAGLAAIAVFVALTLGGILPGGASWPCPWMAACIGLVFLARGLGGFVMHRMSFWKESRAFNDLNQRIYSPLCLVVALLFGLLAGRAFLP